MIKLEYGATNGRIYERCNMKLKIICVTGYSLSVELQDLKDDKPYFSRYPYNVYLNGEEVITFGVKKVFSIFDLTPSTDYELKVVLSDEVESAHFRTLDVEKEINIYQNSSITDHTEIIQEAINSLTSGGAIIINEGSYKVRPLFIKSNITLYLKKGATLVGSTDPSEYPILEGIKDGLPLGSWEGEISNIYASLISVIREKNIKIIGEGTINANADNGSWWVNHKRIKIAPRPKTIYINYGEDVLIEGLTVMNSPSWTIHPYYSHDIAIIDTKIQNPTNSPNTDGIDPESSDNVCIIGNYFDVGDDCIAIKSGKISMVEKYYKKAENIIIRNCYMKNGHGGVTLGSEMSSGIKNVRVNDCVFSNTDRGLRIKTRRGRGEKASVSGIVFENIMMDEVKNPFVINMYYFCDKDGKSDYVQNKEAVEVDKRTPYLGSFTFKNIKCINSSISAAFIYGLPEQKIKNVTFDNVLIEMAPGSSKEYPAMMSDIEMVSGIGCFIKNVEELVLKNFEIKGQIGERLITEKVDKIIEE